MRFIAYYQYIKEKNKNIISIHLYKFINIYEINIRFIIDCYLIKNTSRINY